VCCDSAVCPSNQFCNIFGHVGMCGSRLPDGQVCQKDSDCMNNNCQAGSPSVCAPARTPTPTPTATPLSPGDPCGSTPQCPAGFVCNSGEGVCCNLSSCPTGQSCRVQGHAGFCSLIPTFTPTPTPKAGLGVTCTSAEQCDSGFCTNNVCCEADACPATERCDVYHFEGQCSPLLQQGDQCNKNSDCDTGLTCQFDTVTNHFICDIPRTPTPTLLPTSIPTNTAGIAISTSRGGGCSVGGGNDTGGLWLLAALPVVLWARRARLQRVGVRRAR